MAKSKKKDPHTFSGEEIQDMLEERKNKYILINVITKRSRQLISGEPRLVQDEELTTPLDVIEEEIKSGKLAVRDPNETDLVNSIRKRDKMD